MSVNYIDSLSVHCYIHNGVECQYNHVFSKTKRTSIDVFFVELLEKTTSNNR